jgi:precorrin-6B methylase 1
VGEVIYWHHTSTHDAGQQETAVKPTEEEHRAALAAAETIHDAGDPDHLAKTLAYLQYRVEILENLAEHAKRYVQFGLDEHEHTQLVKAVERLREFDAKQSGEEPEELGLG